MPRGEQMGSVVTYFEDKGFGFLRPEGGGRDVFFHISRLDRRRRHRSEARRPSALRTGNGPDRQDGRQPREDTAAGSY